MKKKKLLEILGAELILVPAAPYKNPNNYVRYSKKLSEDLSIKEKNKTVFWANQFDNTSNLNAHFNTTGPEIWEQTCGKVDGFICAIGSGGTIAGVTKYLKKKNPKIQIGLSDPYGSALYNYFKINEMKSEGNSITEGIGQGRITKNFEGIELDDALRVKDDEALLIIFKLLKEEGLFLGGSSGVNVAGAIKLAKRLGPGHNIVTILCDSGQRYQSKIWNPVFLKSKNLPIPDWLM